MTIAYKPKGVCSNHINLDVDDGIINHVKFEGGCPGNLLAIGKLLQGKDVIETIEKLNGIKCGHKETSCADQLAQALKTTL